MSTSIMTAIDKAIFWLYASMSNDTADLIALISIVVAFVVAPVIIITLLFKKWKL